MKTSTDLLRHSICAVIGSAGLSVALSVFADDITGEDELLCYGMHAAVCTRDETCETMEPSKLNLPDFIELDLSARIATTTDEVSEKRETPIENMRRNDGIIMLQGLQGEWAFSWVIVEATGRGTLTVGSADEGATIFTACTVD